MSITFLPRRLLNLLSLGALLTGGAAARAETVALSSLDLTKIRQGHGATAIHRPVAKNSVKMGGKVFEDGLNTAAPSLLYIDLQGQTERFLAFVGIGDQSHDSGAVQFRIYGDGKLLWKSDVLKSGDQPRRVDVFLRGVRRLVLAANNVSRNAIDTSANWAEAKFEVRGAFPVTLPAPESEPYILTPKPGPEPRINGPQVFGVRPGSPFLYTIPATGDRPMTFISDDLPKGLTLDAATGRITGRLMEKGEYHVHLRAANAVGKAGKPFRIVVGDGIALTPPMGWNSWNCWGGAVSQEKVESSARAMVEKGLRDHGWTYINVDDGWQGVRGGPSLAIEPNSKFPDMKMLGEKIHAMGLKFGIYSSPWRGTYEGHIGSSCDNADGTYDWIRSDNCNSSYRIGSDATWNHDRRTNYAFGKYPLVDQDAAQWGRWGVDYLKYDWAPNDVKSTASMADALHKTGRDVVYSLSNEAPFDGARDWARLSNAWRTTADITDTWQSMSTIGFEQGKWVPYAGPGHWNDPDMLVVGDVGWGHPHPTRLTADEQYTHISLWCLLSAPLLLGCSLDTLDEFTLGLLTNDEVLEIDQDALGRQATPIAQEDGGVVYAKPLADGSWAIGLFNTEVIAQTLSVRWADLKIEGAPRVRDLWRQKECGRFKNGYSVDIPAHGVVLLRVSPEN